MRPSVPAPSAPSLLIVDDNFINLQLARMTLEAAGYRVSATTDAQQVLALVDERRPDLILMDIQMPGIDGLTLTRRLKADPATASIAVVAVTSYAMKGDAERMLAAGCDGYIPKPLDVLAFPGQIAAYLDAQHGGARPHPGARSL